MRNVWIVAVTTVLALSILACNCNIPLDLGPLGSGDDLAYVTCAVPVVTALAELLGDISTASESGDVQSFCSENARWEQRAADIMEAHAKCREPEDTDLMDAATNTDLSLDKLHSGLGYSDQFCTSGDTAAEGLARQDLSQAGQYLGKAAEAMYRFGVPQIPAELLE